MPLVRWHPVREFARLRDEMDRLFGQALSDRWWPNGAEIGPRFPAVDVYEDEGRVVIQADLPGVSKEDIDVTVNDDVVVINGKTSSESEQREDGWYHRERVFGQFRRAVRLPSNVDLDAGEAKLEEGVLTLTFPKQDEPEGGRKLTIE